MNNLSLNHGHNFVNLEVIAKDFVNNVFGRKDRTIEERMRMIESDAIADLQEEKYSSYEIKGGLAKMYRGHEGFYEDLHPSDVHIMGFNKRENSIVYKIGSYIQRGDIDLIIGWD
ncbi:MAG: hypothetical protein KKE23_03165 [Nanoarchaeota archaeon]|nr:hypothetical protein [Nanoarchaeota archaeon]